MSSPKKRLLCVEDHESMCQLISVILRDYEVISARGKAEAKRLLASEPFDLILLDYYLPDGTGFELCLFIRTSDQKTPILFVTGELAITEAEVLNLGAQGLVRKGASLVEKLKAAVSNIFP